MQDLFKRFIELNQQKNDLKAREKELNAEIKVIEQNVLDYMAETGMDKVSYDGNTVYLAANLSVAAKDKASAIEYMKEIAPELVKPTMNTNSLRAFVKEMKAEQALPEDFEDHFEITEFYQARVRRG